VRSVESLMIRALPQRKRQVLIQVDQRGSREGGLVVEVTGVLVELARVVLRKELVLRDVIEGYAVEVVNTAIDVVMGVKTQIPVMRMDLVSVRY
jgi:hypothetical protein